MQAAAADLVTQAARPLVLHFEDPLHTSTREFTGGPTEANPPLFVELQSGGARATCFSEAAAMLAKCAHACVQLKKKTCAQSVVLHQVCALVEHTFTCVLPLPLPKGAPGAEHCVWGGDSSLCVMREQQMQVLEELRKVGLVYMGSSFSSPHDRSTDGARATTMGALLSIFDCVLRVQVEHPPLKMEHPPLKMEHPPW